jgi:hypothetical protein
MREEGGEPSPPREATMRSASTVRLVVLVLAAATLAACGAMTPTSPAPAYVAPSSVGEAPPGMTPEATATLAASTVGSSSQPPTAAPTFVPLVLGGTWVEPKANGRLTSYKTTLSAKPTATGDGVTTFTEVTFSATWAGTVKKTACKATEPTENGTWTCEANLLALGVPPGKVTFSFDVSGVGVPVAHSPDGTRRITYAVVPPRPTNTRLEQLEQPDFEGGHNSAILHRVRWSAPSGYADEFVVYETFECPRPSTRENSGKPCFVAGTPVDVSKLEPRAKAAGDADSVELRLTEYECGPSHGTILLRALNSYGKSVFAIVEAAPVMWAAPGDLIC